MFWEKNIWEKRPLLGKFKNHSELNIPSLPTSTDEVYPDVISCKLSFDNTKVAAFYSDRSFFIWDIKEPKKIGKLRSQQAHSACIWDIQVLLLSKLSNINF
jgi:hypothetical protein